MTREKVLAWLAGRRPEPPADLAERLLALVAAAPDSAFAGDSMAVISGRLGLAVLGWAVERRKVARDAAMDLLAADAFVTYAFEAGSEEGTDVTGLARSLLGEVAL